MRSRIALRLALLAACLPPAGCGPQPMAEQPRYEPLEASRFFADGQAARHLVPGTVSRGQPDEDPVFTLGRKSAPAADRRPSLEGAADYVDAFPFPVGAEALRRGRERYQIFCAPCHDADGDGRGVVVERGYPPAQSFHTERLREAPVGYLIDVMARGYGTMPPYAGQVPPRDRWAIAAYVRALQYSRQARPKELPVEEAMRLLTGRLPVREEMGPAEVLPEIPTDAGSGRYVIPPRR